MLIVIGNKTGSRLFSQELPHVIDSKKISKKMTDNTLRMIGKDDTMETDIAKAFEMPIKVEIEQD